MMRESGNARLAVAMIAVVIIVTAGWFFVSPLFIDRPVDEELPLVADRAAGFPARSEVDRMAPDERERVKGEVLAEAAAMPDHAMREPMTDGQPVVLRRGGFEDADAVHKGQGEALLYRLGDGSYLLRFERFRVTNGPALVVYLAQHPAPASASDVEQGFYALGKLKGNVGNQNYVIPADVDVASYGSAVIWCELFDVLFSPASLRPVSEQ